MGKIIFLLLISFGSALALEGFVRCCGRDEELVKSPSSFSCRTADGNRTSLEWFCKHSKELIQENKGLKMTVDEDGQLVMKMPNRDVTYGFGEYCMGDMYNRVLKKHAPAAVVCYEHQEKYISEVVYGYCMIASTIFLVVTAIAYIAQPDLRDLQGKSVICYCASLATGLGIIAGMKLVPYSDMNLCAVRGFLAYFFVMSSFFWSNAISLQILLSMTRQNFGENKKNVFLWYALYSWGIPIVLTVIMAVVNFLPGDHMKPGIGLNHCWFFGVKQQWQYMYSVMSVLILMNIAIFICTSVLLWHNSISIKTKIVMTIRLFVVMGVPWVWEMLGSVSPIHWAWQVTDVLNSLQGVFIFIVLVICQLCLKEQHQMYNINIISQELPYKKMGA